MAVYAIGDIQGCFSELEQLLKKIKFNAKHDHLWFVGDLVNRGPQSLETILFVQSLKDAARCVLGNHDIHLLACYTGAQKTKPTSTLKQILDSPQVDDIVQWLRQQPLLHHDKNIDWTMVHAGLPPQWDLKLASKCAREVEKLLRSDQYVEFIAQIYGDQPSKWHSKLEGLERQRVIINAFTRLRFCDKYGEMDFDYKGLLGDQPSHLHAWFDIPRKSENLNIVFGHWSALGLRQQHNLLAIDTGCLWGGQLTAARIDCNEPEIYAIDCKAKRKIKTGE